MEDQVSKLSHQARRSVEQRDWNKVSIFAARILQLDNNNAEGQFLQGLAFKISNEPVKASVAFERSLAVDPRRYDSAIELANQYSVMRRNKEAAELLDRYIDQLDNSPLYLDLAGSVYSDIGLPEKALPLYKKATELQPAVDLFQANLATCSVFMGEIPTAERIYKNLLQKNPAHRRNHYQLSRLTRVKDETHLEQMKQLAAASENQPAANIFLYYAMAKELEDLGQWDESFRYYKLAGDTVTSIAKYNIDEDLEIIDTIIDTCSSEWLADTNTRLEPAAKNPIFIVGLPRTGTTLTERIISSHSNVESIGETLFVQMLLRQLSGVQSVENMNSEMIRALKGRDISTLGQQYLDAVGYRLHQQTNFVDKFPMNFLYLGFIAKALPNAKFVHLQRNPLDACFAMYKQIFTWAYKFSYSLENLGTYYVAYQKLLAHWRTVLGDRFIEVGYEDLVSEPEQQTRQLLEQLGLEFEPECLDFANNPAPSTTASSVQVRAKVHTGSINKWQRYEKHLVPLKQKLLDSGISL